MKYVATDIVAEEPETTGGGENGGGAAILQGSLRDKTASEFREIGDKSLILSPILVFEHELNELNESHKSGCGL